MWWARGKNKSDVSLPSYALGIHTHALLNAADGKDVFRRGTEKHFFASGEARGHGT